MRSRVFIRSPYGRRSRVSFGVLTDQSSVLSYQRRRRVERLRHLAHSVWRIDKDEVEGASFSTRGNVRKPSADNSIAVRHRAPLQIGLDERDGARITFDERHECRAAAQRLDANGSAARIAVEERRAGDPRCQDVEQRLA